LLKDKSLLREQLFDVINNENKLRGLEDHPLYPKLKTKKQALKDTGSDYNILSNLGFDVHHYEKPLKRPPPPENKVKTKI
jgi:hypothetical protein